MNKPMNDNQIDLPEAILEDAVIWQARLREVGEADTSERRLVHANFYDWLALDARHRLAFDEMTVLWGSLEEPVVQVLAEQAPKTTMVNQQYADADITAQLCTDHRQKSRFFPRLAAAACLMLAVFAGIVLQQDWVTQWQSDYHTGIGEQLPINMDDGSRITLNTQTALITAFSTEYRRVRLLRGEAWFVVSSDDNRPFIVETSQGEVKVTGTQFNVRVEKDTVIVSLDKGEVWLRASDHKNTPAVRLASGQQAILAADTISMPAPFDNTATTAWLRGQMVFYNTPLSDVVNMLNSHRKGRIQIISDELKNLSVSGVFSTADTDAALEVITSTLPVQQTHITSYLVLLR